MDVGAGRLAPAADRMYRLVASLHPGHYFAAGVAAAAAGLTDVSERDHLLGVLVAANILREVADGRYFCPDQRRRAAQTRSRSLDAAPVRAEAVQRILAWYHDGALSAGARASNQLGETPSTGPRADHTAALDWLDIEQSNLRAVAKIAFNAGQYAVAHGIVHGLSQLYRQGRYGGDWVKIARLGLDAARASNDPDAETRMLVHLGGAHVDHGEPQKGWTYFEEAWKQRIQAQDTAAIAKRKAADVAAADGRYDAATEIYLQALAAHIGLGSTREAVLDLIGLSETFILAGRRDDALAAVVHAEGLVTALADQARKTKDDDGAAGHDWWAANIRKRRWEIAG